MRTTLSQNTQRGQDSREAPKYLFGNVSWLMRRDDFDLSAKNRSLGAHNIQAICQDPTLDYVLLSMDIPEADARVSYSAVPGGRVSVFKCRF